jgi:hypothetical protein
MGSRPAWSGETVTLFAVSGSPLVDGPAPSGLAGRAAGAVVAKDPESRRECQATVFRTLLDILLGPPPRGRSAPQFGANGSPAAIREEALADQLADGSLDPDEIPSSLEPWDEGSDDE